MGNIRSKDIKKISAELRQSYPDRFGINFQVNRDELKKMNIITQKIARNRVAGYITRIGRHGHAASNY